MNRTTLDQFLNFISLTNKFSTVERAVHIKDSAHVENDSEHSYQLAVTAMYLISTNKLKLNMEKTLKYALIHDLVEIYAGDPHAIINPEKRKDKVVKERKALKKLRKEFPEFTDLFHVLDEYNDLNLPEAKFIYSLDKLLPIINIYLNDGKSWNIDKINLAMIKKAKNDKINVSKEVYSYYNEFIKILEESEEKLFD